MKLYTNGYIVKRLDSEWACKYNKTYAGIEGDIWPLDLYDGVLDDNIQELMEKIEEKTDLAQYKDLYVGVCDDRDIIEQYAKVCKLLGFQIDILFVETSKPMPKADSIDESNFVFLGYDYGFSGPDYYSCVYNDIVRRDIRAFESIEVNKYGLFEDENMLNVFINVRLAETLKSETSKYEAGNFIPYKIWKQVV